MFEDALDKFVGNANLIGTFACRYRLTAVLLCAAAVTGCAGYQIGNQGLYPPDIQTVSVPIFASESFRRNFGERLTEAVVKEIELKTPLKVVNSGGADSILYGRLTNDTKRVLIETRTDEPRETEVSLSVSISWVDRQGAILRQNEIPLPAEFTEFTQTASVVPEFGQSVATAHQTAIQRMAEQIVGSMEIDVLPGL
jgi:hypothetical protein